MDCVDDWFMECCKKKNGTGGMRDVDQLITVESVNGGLASALG